MSSGPLRSRQLRSALSSCVLLFFIFAIFGAPSARARQEHASNQRQATPDIRAYAGTWKASFHGKVFAILVLGEKNGSLEGTLNNFEIAADKAGNLIDGTHIDIGVSPIISPRFKNGALIFTVAQKDAYSQTTDWSFVVTSRNRGELTENLDNQYEMPMNAVVKPIPMLREVKR